MVNTRKVLLLSGLSLTILKVSLSPRVPRLQELKASFFVAADDGVGMAVSDSVVHLVLVGVDARLRGRGVGSASTHDEVLAVGRLEHIPEVSVRVVGGPLLNNGGTSEDLEHFSLRATNQVFPINVHLRVSLLKDDVGG